MIFNVAVIFSISFYSVMSHGSNCFPENSMKIPLEANNYPIIKSLSFTNEQSGLSEIEYNQIIDTFEVTWGPIVVEKYDKKLKIQRNWESAKVNASTTRDDDNNPVIIVDGGLARHPSITKNGLLLILCHELGHHYGGAPKSFRGRSKKRSWSSAEGQADYFATNKCMPKLSEKNMLFIPKYIGEDVESFCADNWCRKISPAALSVTRLFASLKNKWNEPSVVKKSRRSVSITDYGHPTPQCRLDTFMAGSLCISEFNQEFDDGDYKVGSCLKDTEPTGARPSCWFSSVKY